MDTCEHTLCLDNQPDFVNRTILLRSVDFLRSFCLVSSSENGAQVWQSGALALMATLAVLVLSNKAWRYRHHGHGGKTRWASESNTQKAGKQTGSTEIEDVTPKSSTQADSAAAAAAAASASATEETITPTSVNYHFNRKCNYQCGFCFHTAKTSYYLPLEEAKKGLKMLQDAGMQKINFSGGEPFIVDRGRYVGELVRYCKRELKLSGVTIVSNGSLIREKWFKEYGVDLDILSVSCDSFDPETNFKTGRQQGLKDHIQGLKRVRDWCSEYKIAFKINSVINTFNKDEDMFQNIMMLNPIRWKAYQCLVINGENAGPEALRNAERFVITDEEFQEFLDRHKDVPFLVPESNETMRYSYIILDEYMRFLDGGEKKPSPSILDVGVEAAINRSKFDEKMYLKRGGKYVWSKADMKLDW